MHDWHYFFHHGPQNLENGIYRIFEPEWKAEILHWFSREDVPKEQKEEFIKALIDFEDGCGDFYRYRAYFLASESLAQFKDCSLGDAIVGQLLKWSYAYFRQDKRDWKVFPDELVRAARAGLEVTDRERVIAAFVQLVHTTQSRTILGLAAKRLGQLDPGNKRAIAGLVLLIQVTQDKKTLSKLVSSLLEIGSGNETEIAALVQLLQRVQAGEDTDEPYISNTFYLLRRIGYGSQTAIAGLVHLMETTLNKDICEKAIETLGRIADGNQTAIAAFVSFLETNQGDYICREAVKALWQIDPGNPVAINALVQLPENMQDEFLLWEAALHIVENDTYNSDAVNAVMPQAIATLVRFIETTQFVDVCAEGIHALEKIALEKINTNNETALAALFQFLETIQDEQTRWSVVESLLRIDEVNAAGGDVARRENVDSGNKIALAALIQLLETTQDEWIRSQAVESLLRIDPGNEIALATLSQLLETAENAWRRLEVAKKLLQIDDKCQKAIDTLCELVSILSLQSFLPPDDSALSILENIDPSHQLAIQALVQLTNTTWDQDALIHAAKNLERLDPGNEIAKEKLNKLIAAVLQSMQTFQEDDDGCLLNIGIYSRGILQSDCMPQAVTALKHYLREQFCRHTPLKYDLAFDIIWNCAQKMSYQDFYKAWHK